MRSLVVFFSRTGTTRKVARLIAKFLKSDLEELQESKSRKGVFGWLRSGRESAFKSKPLIHLTKNDPSDYDLVIIGTPVWAGSMSSPVRSFLHDNKFRRVAFFCTMGNSVAKAFVDMQSMSKKPLATLALTTKQVVNDDYLSQVKCFVSRLR